MIESKIGTLTWLAMELLEVERKQECSADGTHGSLTSSGRSAEGPTGLLGKINQMPAPFISSEPPAALLVTVVRGEVIQKVLGSSSDSVR